MRLPTLYISCMTNKQTLTFLTNRGQGHEFVSPWTNNQWSLTKYSIYSTIWTKDVTHRSFSVQPTHWLTCPHSRTHATGNHSVESTWSQTTKRSNATSEGLWFTHVHWFWPRRSSGAWYSRIGFILFLNTALIVWSLKKQGTLETSAKQFSLWSKEWKCLRGLHCKIRMMGVARSECLNIYGDNVPIIHNTQYLSPCWKRKSS